MVQIYCGARREGRETRPRAGSDRGGADFTGRSGQRTPFRPRRPARRRGTGAEQRDALHFLPCSVPAHESDSEARQGKARRRYRLTSAATRWRYCRRVGEDERRSPRVRHRPRLYRRAENHRPGNRHPRIHRRVRRVGAGRATSHSSAGPRSCAVARRSDPSTMPKLADCTSPTSVVVEKSATPHCGSR
jgi:hypothetical protein